MGFLFFWLITVIGSYTIALRLIFIMMKDLADAGYKLNLDNLKKFNGEVTQNNTNSNILLFIPILNMFYSFKMVIDYNNTKWNILDQFSVLGVLESLSPEEKREYEKEPTLLNAFMLSVLKENSNFMKDDNIDLDDSYDKNMKTIEENGDLSDKKLIEKVQEVMKSQKSDSCSRLDEISKEKEDLENYKEDLINSYKKEEVKTLVKKPNSKKEN